MDENEYRLSPEQEISMPSPQTEFNDPLPPSDYSPPPQQSREQTEKQSADKAAKQRLAKRMVALVAAGAAAVTLLGETAPEPELEPEPVIEYVDTESSTVIDCAAVLPDEPDILRFSDHSPGIMPGISEFRRQIFLVEPDGTEMQLYARTDEVYTRYEFRRLETMYRDDSTFLLLPGSENAYAYHNDPEWVSYGTIGFHMDCAAIDTFRDGQSLKLVDTYESGGVYYREITLCPVVMLPPEPEIHVSLSTVPLGPGVSEAHFRAVFHPQDGDGHDYYFGDLDQLYAEHPEVVTTWTTEDGGLRIEGQHSIRSFCVRWYDSDHRFLNEGWSLVMGVEDVMPYQDLNDFWPYPAIRRDGRDFIIEYDGPVRSSSPNAEAAYYSLEVNLVDMSTGWHYLLESEQVPVAD